MVVYACSSVAPYDRVGILRCELLLKLTYTVRRATWSPDIMVVSGY